MNIPPKNPPDAASLHELVLDTKAKIDRAHEYVILRFRRDYGRWPLYSWVENRFDNRLGDGLKMTAIAGDHPPAPGTAAFATVLDVDVLNRDPELALRVLALMPCRRPLCKHRDDQHESETLDDGAKRLFRACKEPGCGCAGYLDALTAGPLS